MTASTFQVEHPTLRTAPPKALTGASSLPGAFDHLALTTTVPKEFVHRAAVAEVLLTGWERTDDTRFTVRAQWPRAHSFFTAVEGRHDPLIAAETIRQVGSLLAHAEFGVPLGHHFLMWELNIAVHPEQLHIGAAPASLELDITCPDIKRRGRTLAALRYEAVIRRDGQPLATGSASYSCASPTVYQRLRTPHTPPTTHPRLPLTAPVAPQTVGRTSPTDVVLTPLTTPHHWQLRLDTRHPVLFDHPVDHVPGMVLIEAARQATATVLPHPLLPLSLTSTFHRYAELHTPCIIKATPTPNPGPNPGPHTPVQITGHQNGQPVFHCTVTPTPH
ncbi:hypothetical protein OG250_46490 [Streptomyces sp. NBC_00487]|uniref:ScbA/BarX family gamma-butyrolactone biosynthesis protein n=1 Tax=unclassified Streptomyces TaxID=2593676 RepID=UPI002E181F5B|nr:MULTISPECIES: ScbA/BarX family gamma-butyrolactone biosynthesis protein [unclassified Streptomyces]